MVHPDDTELIDRFEEFYRSYYRDEIADLAQKYPSEQKSLYIDWNDLSQFDSDLADDFRNRPVQLLRHAEEALRLYDLPVDVSLGQAHVRMTSLPELTKIREIRADHRGMLITVQGIVREASDINPKVTTVSFECQRCGTLTRIPQDTDDLQEPHECQGCEQQGPFQMNYDQSAFIDTQELILIEDLTEPPSGVVPERITINVKDDITSATVAGKRIKVTGVLKLEQQSSQQQNSAMFSVYMDALSIESIDISEHGEPLLESSSVEIDSYVDSASVALATMPKSAREEETKAKLVTPFIQALGWNKYDSRQVRLEYTEETTRCRPDYALFRDGGGSPDIIVEAKKLNKPLAEKEGQLYDYIRVFGSEWGILTNGQEYRLYYNGERVDEPRPVAQLTIDELATADVLDHLQPNTDEISEIDVGMPREERERLEQLVDFVSAIEQEYPEGAPVEVVRERFVEFGLDKQEAEEAIDDLKQKGKVYQHKKGHLRAA